MTRGVSRFQYMRTHRKTKTTKHTGGNLSERVFCKTVKFQKRVTRLGEFSVNSKITLYFGTLTKRRASGLEAGRALSQCWRNSQPRSICFNIVFILLATLLGETLHLFNPLCSFFFITITAVGFTSAVVTATHTLPKSLKGSSTKKFSIA